MLILSQNSLTTNTRKNMNGKGFLDCIVICVGDLVRAEFTCPTNTCTVRVMEIERRYGMTIRGTRMNPLVIGVDTKTNKKETFDARFVKEIIERRTSKVKYPKKNIFREATDSLRVKVEGKRWTGTMCSLTVKALARLPYEFDRPLDEERLTRLFYKTGIGCKNRIWGSILTVDQRRFCRWVSKNYTRIVMTSRACGEQATREEQDLDEAFRKDFELMEQRLSYESDMPSYYDSTGY